MELLKSIVTKNIEGATAFVDRLLQHDGEINFQHLYKVVETDNLLSLIHGNNSNSDNNYSVLIGGEASNSFCPLYEISSLFRGLFLTGVGTAFLNRYSNIIDHQKYLGRPKIALMLLDLDELALKDGMENPIITMVCDLDTDIEPYRYVKHQLWGLSEESLKKRCADISRDELLNAEIDLSLKDIYWIEEDWEINQKAIYASKSLPEAKAIQFYLTGKIFLDKLGVDISKSRLYFQFVPKEELMLLGADSEVLQVIRSLHNPQSMAILSKLLGSKTPWIFSFSCPNCGESSKRVIRPKFNKTFDVVKLKCSESKREFRNELGTILTRQGCGHKWEVPIPQRSDLLFQMLEQSSFTVNCAVRELIRVIKSSSISPICYVANNIGVCKYGEQVGLISDLPKGFGDHRKLMTSVFSLQHLMITGELSSDITNELKAKKLLKAKEMQLMIRASLDRLYDNELECFDCKDLYVTDTSALKALRKGTTVWEMFQRAIDIQEITLLELKALQKRHPSMTKTHDSPNSIHLNTACKPLLTWA